VDLYEEGDMDTKRGLDLRKFIIDHTRKTLPGALREKLFNFSFNIAPEQFQKFAYLYGGAPKMEPGLVALRNRGFDPRVIFDVGAFEGTFCRMARRIWPRSQIVMFEGNQEKESVLSSVARQVNAQLKMSLLGPEDGKDVDFFVMESGSSILEENSPLKRSVVRHTMARLDTVAGGLRPDFLKLDVQGFELQVLRGADEILQSVEAVMMEVSLIEINKGAPLFAEVVGFMADRGFEVADIIEIHRRPLDQATNQVDLFFVRSAHALLSDHRHFV
jgi:FkbM family methyltransferase